MFAAFLVLLRGDVDESGCVWKNFCEFLVLMEEFELICLCLSCDYTATLWE